jgi:hypothetical protein
MDLRGLVAWIKNSMAECCIAVENTRFKELFETGGESLGTTCQIYQMIDVVVWIEGVRPWYILIEWICAPC